jgi:hypothetical protein
MQMIQHAATTNETVALIVTVNAVIGLSIICILLVQEATTRINQAVIDSKIDSATRTHVPSLFPDPFDIDDADLDRELVQQLDNYFGSDF